MAKPEWGVKRVCQSCAVKFYDLKRSPINCPKCGARFNPEALLKSRRSRPPTPPKTVKPGPTEPKTATDEADAETKADAAPADAAPGDGEKDDKVVADTAKVSSTGAKKDD